MHRVASGGPEEQVWGESQKQKEKKMTLDIFSHQRGAEIGSLKAPRLYLICFWRHVPFRMCVCVCMCVVHTAAFQLLCLLTCSLLGKDKKRGEVPSPAGFHILVLHSTELSPL